MRNDGVAGSIKQTESDGLDRDSRDVMVVTNLVSMKQCEEPESIRVRRDREIEGIVRLT